METIYQYSQRNINSNYVSKNEVVGTQFTTKRVNRIQLTYSTSSDIRQRNDILIDKYQLHDEKGDPITGGVNSLTLGTSQYKYTCSTCLKDATKC